jgi:hypothetical protein
MPRAEGEVMFTWFRERKKFERDTRIMINALTSLVQEHIIAVEELQKANWAINNRLDEIEKVQRTLCDDMYDIQADMTLIHNIEGYEEWRTEIGKPVKEPNKASFAASHDINCEFHHDQYPQECTCGAYKPIAKPTDIVK